MGTAGLGHSEINMLSRKFQAPILASHYKLLFFAISYTEQYIYLLFTYEVVLAYRGSYICTTATTRVASMDASYWS